MADDKGRGKISDLRKDYEQANHYQEMLLNLQKEELNNISSIYSMKKKLLLSQAEYNAEQQKLDNILKAYNKKLAEGYTFTKNTTKQLEKELKQQQDIALQAKKNFEHNQRLNNVLKSINISWEKIGNSINGLWPSLQLSDKIIKNTVLNLGMTGQKADEIRTSFENSAGYIARMGGSLKDIQEIMLEYADETGRAKILTADMVKDIFTIASGTGLSVTEASKLSAQFELMGLNARASFSFVDDFRKNGEKLGININKALRSISSNFNKLQSMSFNKGTEAFKTMALYSQKFNVNMSDALSSTEKFRTLDSAVSSMAELQVLGGEFAKTNPFEMMFLSRNDPSKYMEKINEMTRGIFTYKKMANGLTESYISPLDVDRLKQASKVLGIDYETLSAQARRTAEISRMRQQMVGAGYSKADREIVEGMATYDSKLGKFFVSLNGSKRDIASISRDELKVLGKRNDDLKQTTLNAQTFDEAFKNTMSDLKSVFLPMLQGINGVLGIIRPYMVKLGEITSKFQEHSKVLIAGLGIGLLGAAKVLMPIVSALNKGISQKITSSLGGGNLGGSSVISTKAPTTLSGGLGKGLGALGGGAGIGLAGLGVGEGINAAAQGISKLSDSMSKLTPEQAKTLQNIVLSLTGLAAVGIAASVGIAAMGGSATAVAPGLLALGGTVALIGVGIGAATAGIGLMVNGLNNLLTSSKGGGDDLLKVAGGIAAIQGALAVGGVATLFTGGAGVLAFGKVISSIATNAPALANVGDAFKDIAVVLSGSKENYQAIEKMIKNISQLDVAKLEPLNKLANLFNGTVKVEFADKDVAIVSNISINMDGNKLFTGTNIGKRALIETNSQRNGKLGSKGLS